MVLRIDEGRPGLVEVLARERPEPVLPRFEAADHRVPGLLPVRRGVLGRRGVAAADVAALGAPAQVQPPAVGRLAFGAAGAARPRFRVYALHLYCHPSAPPWVGSAVMGRRTWKRVSPGADSTRRSPWCLLTTIRHAMSSPSPVPSPTGLVVKNGSKMRCCTS